MDKYLNIFCKCTMRIIKERGLLQEYHNTYLAVKQTAKINGYTTPFSVLSTTFIRTIRASLLSWEEKALFDLCYNRFLKRLYLIIVQDFLRSDSPTKDKFIDCLAKGHFKHGKRDANEYCTYLVQNERTEDFISHSFLWEDTEDGHEYWQKLSQKFKHCEKFW